MGIDAANSPEVITIAQQIQSSRTVRQSDCRLHGGTPYRPGYADALEMRTWAYEDKGELDKAIADWDAAIQLQQLAVYYDFRGNVTRRRGIVTRRLPTTQRPFGYRRSSRSVLRARFSL